MNDQAKRGRGFWNTLKVEWYRRGLRYSNMAEKVLGVMLRRTKQAESFLDVGAGCGTLTIPLARAGKKVTALEPSTNMFAALEEEIKATGVRDVRTINALWGEADVDSHDVIVCANVPELLKDSTNFLIEADRLAERAVFLITGADPLADKFYYKELYPLIFGKPFPPRTDYLKTYTNLHSLGIYANVEIIEYDFDQPFKDLEEAIEFWKEYMGIVTEEHDEKLRDFLDKKLDKDEEGPVARFHKKSAVIWWHKEQGA